MENEKIKLTPAQRGRMYGLIKRLESGKYNQGQNRLRIDRHGEKPLFCCLGVAGNMLVEKKVCKWNDDLLKTVDDSTGSRSRLPYGSERLFGFNTSYVVDNKEGQDYYIDMNDNQGKSFMEIAAELRKNFGFKPRKDAKV